MEENNNNIVENIPADPVATEGILVRKKGRGGNASLILGIIGTTTGTLALLILLGMALFMGAGRNALDLRGDMMNGNLRIVDAQGGCRPLR